MKPLNNYHRKVCEWLSELGIGYSEEYPVGKWSLDIYIGEMNLGVEIDGKGFHSPKKDKIRDDRILGEFAIPIVRIKVGTGKQEALDAIFS